jgi:hypothetical protein
MNTNADVAGWSALNNSSVVVEVLRSIYRLVWWVLVGESERARLSSWSVKQPAERTSYEIRTSFCCHTTGTHFLPAPVIQPTISITDFSAINHAHLLAVESTIVKLSKVSCFLLHFIESIAFHRSDDIRCEAKSFL